MAELAKPESALSAILVVETTASEAQRVAEVLLAGGLAVEVCSSSDEAVRQAAAKPPRLLIASSHLPGTAELLGRFARPSGGPGSLVLLAPELAGRPPAAFHADAALVRPFTDAELLRVVRTMIGATDPMATSRLSSAEIFGDLLAEVEAAVDDLEDRVTQAPAPAPSASEPTIPQPPVREPTAPPLASPDATSPSPAPPPPARPSPATTTRLPIMKIDGGPAADQRLADQRPVSHRSADDEIERRLEKTLSGVLPGAEKHKRSEPPEKPSIAATQRIPIRRGGGSSEVDDLLEKTLSTLELPPRPRKQTAKSAPLATPQESPDLPAPTLETPPQPPERGLAPESIAPENVAPESVTPEGTEPKAPSPFMTTTMPVIPPAAKPAPDLPPSGPTPFETLHPGPATEPGGDDSAEFRFEEPPPLEVPPLPPEPARPADLNEALEAPPPPPDSPTDLGVFSTQRLPAISLAEATPADSVEDARPNEDTKADVELAEAEAPALGGPTPTGAGELAPLEAEAAPPQKGHPFGEYTLLERIATGGMAEVWQARRRGVEGFQKTVAIKRILSHLTSSSDFVTMFIDEAKLAAQLNHANIIQIYDLGKVDGDFFIAMEHVDGLDLRSILTVAGEKRRPIPLGLALFIAGSVARALDFAHRKRDFENRDMGLVHRDISPQNVLISYEGEIKLCDFGIAKAVAKASVTQIGALKGKLQYMSPEQALGQTVDARSDIFSLGAVLFEILTGRRLFAGDSEIGVLDAVRECRIQGPRELVPQIPERVDRIVRRALAKDPIDRYPTAGELEDDIKGALGDLRPVPGQGELASYLQELATAPAAEPPADDELAPTVPEPVGSEEATDAALEAGEPAEEPSLDGPEAAGEEEVDLTGIMSSFDEELAEVGLPGGTGFDDPSTWDEDSWEEEQVRGETAEEEGEAFDEEPREFPAAPGGDRLGKLLIGLLVVVLIVVIIYFT